MFHGGNEGVLGTSQLLSYLGNASLFQTYLPLLVGYHRVVASV